MLAVLKTHLPSDTPIIGCEVTPYVLVRRADSTLSTEDFPETGSYDDGVCLRSRWYRSVNSRKVAVCSVHSTELATLQCVLCLKNKVPVHKSYHCTQKCFQAHWEQHKALHSRAQTNGADGDDEGSAFRGAAGAPNGESWIEIGRGRCYTPTQEDVGHILKFEVVPYEMHTETELEATTSVLTGRVISIPPPPTRNMLPIEGAPAISAPSNFTVLTYNVLADLYATADMYGSYCPHYALNWSYRKQSLLREILSYRADVLCLQEVQSDHFEDFFAPELQKHGYTAVYKKKTAQVYTGNTYTIDGCATFFRTDRFALVKKYEVEFNKAAMSLSEALSAANQKKAALNRLLKDNVALIVVFEALEGPDQGSGTGKRQLICVANTHIHANQELKDVKLWQVHTLLKGLEKIAASADIPMLVTGDFNSIPGSAPHSLLATGRVDANHPELSTDPLGILRPPSKLCHQLPLVSAYTAYNQPGLALSLGLERERQKGRVDETTSEPLFTNYSGEFNGTLDYIFYTANSLQPTSLLELPTKEEVLSGNSVGLPSPNWPSDHIAMMAEFSFKMQ
mmetsp:Transcript_35685/g.43022  ORF Transcript_35685/g.43022 Transcript_35685/m.43022 type:complete len:566 (+) Transcript_35685:143-1840(+)